LAEQTTGPLREPSSYSLDRATAAITSGGRTIQLAKESGEFERFAISANEQVAVKLQIPEAVSGQSIFISASNGGRLLRADDGPLSFTVTSERLDLPLLFTPTLGHGSYTIEVRHAGAPLTLRFLVGGDGPAGQPGPAYATLPPDSAEVP
jgi:hypothetical protein